MAFELFKGRAAFFRRERTDDKQPLLTGKLVLPRDAKAGDIVYVSLWDGNNHEDYLTGTAKVASS